MTRKLDLVSAGTAAAILGIPHSGISKLRNRGRLTGVSIEGTADVYHRADVLKLAKQLEGQRAERQERAA